MQDFYAAYSEPRVKDGRSVILAIDVEGVGQYESNPTFAVGVAITVDGQLSYTAQSALDLGVPGCADGVSGKESPLIRQGVWKTAWERNGWEPRCWEEAWRKKVAVLDRLQDPSRIKLFKDVNSFAAEVASYFELAVHLGENLSVVTDAVSYDPQRINHLLQSCTTEKFASITYTPRSKLYTSWMCVDSLIQGAAGFKTHETDWSVVCEISERLCKFYPLSAGSGFEDLLKGVEKHEPIYDSMMILQLYHAIEKHHAYIGSSGNFLEMLSRLEDKQRRAVRRRKVEPSSSHC